MADGAVGGDEGRDVAVPSDGGRGRTRGRGSPAFERSAEGLGSIDLHELLTDDGQGGVEQVLLGDGGTGLTEGDVSVVDSAAVTQTAGEVADERLADTLGGEQSRQFSDGVEQDGELHAMGAGEVDRGGPGDGRVRYHAEELYVIGRELVGACIDPGVSADGLSRDRALGTQHDQCDGFPLESDNLARKVQP